MLLRLLLARLPWLCIVLTLLVASGCSTVSEPDTASDTFRRTSAARGSIKIDDEEAIAYARGAVALSRISSHVYCRYLKRESSTKKDRERCESLKDVRDLGWIPLYDWTEVLTSDEQKSGISFMAFARQSPTRPGIGEIVIGFRGTDFTSAHDWRSNLRWFLRFMPGDDQYDIVHRNAVPLVTMAFEKAAAVLPSSVKSFQTYATGHSLGGGLAQLLAYSDHRVNAAIVFDPTPVTGYSTLVSDEQVNCSARVVRIYEHGEILSYLRSFTRQFFSLSDNIEEISFNFIHAGFDVIVNHSMTLFRKGLEKKAGVSEAEVVFDTPPILSRKPDCRCYVARQPKYRPDEANECRATRALAFARNSLAASRAETTITPSD